MWCNRDDNYRRHPWRPSCSASSRKSPTHSSPCIAEWLRWSSLTYLQERFDSSRLAPGAPGRPRFGRYLRDETLVNLSR